MFWFVQRPLKLGFKNYLKSGQKCLDFKWLGPKLNPTIWKLDHLKSYLQKVQTLNPHCTSKTYYGPQAKLITRTEPYSRPEGTACLTVQRTALPTNNCRKNSRDSQPQGSSADPGWFAVGRRAILGASISDRARVLSGGGPFLGCPRITTAPPSRTWNSRVTVKQGLKT